MEALYESASLKGCVASVLPCVFSVFLDPCFTVFCAASSPRLHLTALQQRQNHPQVICHQDCSCSMNSACAAALLVQGGVTSAAAHAGEMPLRACFGACQESPTTLGYNSPRETACETQHDTNHTSHGWAGGCELLSCVLGACANESVELTLDPTPVERWANA